MSHWALQYIGREWIAQTHDCWAFFRQVQRDQFAREIPPFDVDSLSRLSCARAVEANPERQKWSPTATPKEGDAVLMAHSKFPSHIGLWVEVDGGGVLHCIEGAGVVFQSRQSLAACGWGHVEFYSHGR